MSVFKVVFFGNEKSGKTQLSNRITSKNEFNEQYLQTVGVDFSNIILKENYTITIWDICGCELYTNLYPNLFSNADIVVFCVDLSTAIDKSSIITKIEQLRKTLTAAPILLVGTKSDLPEENIEAFKQLKTSSLFRNTFITSAKESTGIRELYNEIEQICLEKKQTLWDEAVKNFNHCVNNAGLSEYKKKLLGDELKKLAAIILAESEASTITPLQRAEAIEAFSTKCETILEDKHPKVLKAVLSVAVAAVVTSLAMILGFGVGFACGLWSGPGAFITGLIAGSHAAVAVASSSAALGVLGGGVAAYGLFKTSKEIKSLNEFVTQVSSWEREIIL